METSREDFMNELRLRKYIRKAIKVVKERRANRHTDEEKKLRTLIRRAVLQEKEREPLYPETGKNFLDSLFLDTGFLKRLKLGYKELKSTEEQRSTFREHIIYHVLRTLETQGALDKEGDQSQEEPKIELSEQDETTISVVDQDDRLMGTEPEKETPEEKEDKELESFRIPGKDLGDSTGIKQAFDTFNLTEVKSAILRYWNRMGNDADKEVFYDNMKEQLSLYFDTWEEEVQAEIQASPGEPGVPAPEEVEPEEPEALELEPEVPEEELELGPME